MFPKYLCRYRKVFRTVQLSRKNSQYVSKMPPPGFASKPMSIYKLNRVGASILPCLTSFIKGELLELSRGTHTEKVRFQTAVRG